MSDDLREQIARALYESYTLPGEPPWSRSENQHFFLHKADAVLTVVQPVIEQAERERDALERHAEWCAERAVTDESTIDQLRARVATLEAALRRLDEAITDQGPMPEYHQRIMLRHRDEWPTLWDAIDAARAALGEQDTAAPVEENRL